MLHILKISQPIEKLKNNKHSGWLHIKIVSIGKSVDKSILKTFCISQSVSAPGGGGVLGISCDGDDQRIFLGLKFSIPGFFWVQKFGKNFLGSLI